MLSLGMGGETGDSLAAIIGKSRVLHFLGTGVPGMRRLGWTVAVCMGVPFTWRAVWWGWRTPARFT